MTTTRIENVKALAEETKKKYAEVQQRTESDEIADIIIDMIMNCPSLIHGSSLRKYYMLPTTSESKTKCDKHYVWFSEVSILTMCRDEDESKNAINRIRFSVRNVVETAQKYGKLDEFIKYIGSALVEYATGSEVERFFLED